MDEYRKNYINFQKTIDDCKSLSVKFAGIPSPTPAHFYASLIFTKLCTSSITTLNICPNPEDIGRNVHWDCASVAALTRGIIETYLVFFYLCIQNCDKEEWEARWRLMNLHDHMSRLKMFRVLNGAEDQVQKFEGYADQVKSDLANTDYFRSLDEKQQKHYLKGHTAFFQSKDEIIEATGNRVDEFRFRYRFLSNHTHSYPMGFYRMAENFHGNGVESKVEIEYSTICLTWATEYLVIAKDGFSGLWTWKD